MGWIPDMNTPEKIFIEFERNIRSWNTERKLECEVEYHLAPQWHDAVKEPPEDGFYPCRWQGGIGWATCKCKAGRWFIWNDEVHPDWYYPLPQQPERSE
jgi:hypothetical protein